MNETEKRLWVYAILHGEVEYSYTGFGRADRDVCNGRTKRLKEYLGVEYSFDKSKNLNQFIDWDKMSPISDNTDYDFDGTDQPSKTIPTLTGILYTLDGHKYPWKCRLNTDFNGLSDILRELVALDLNTLL